jgi:hypothetical protein
MPGSGVLLECHASRVGRLGVGVGSLRHTPARRKRSLTGRRVAQQFAPVKNPQRASHNPGEVVLRMHRRSDVKT